LRLTCRYTINNIGDIKYNRNNNRRKCNIRTNNLKHNNNDNNKQTEQAPMLLPPRPPPPTWTSLHAPFAMQSAETSSQRDCIC
jgi:hypothetical protein